MSEIKFEVVERPDRMVRGKYAPLWDSLLKLDSGKCVRIETNGDDPKKLEDRITQSLYYFARESGQFRVHYRTTPEALYYWLSPKKEAK